MNKANTPKPKYIAEFEGVRALMAWWVVLGHIANYAGIFYHRDLAIWLKPVVMTNVSVDVFIALSGFAIFSLLTKSEVNYGRFMLGRAFRMYPAYFVCVLIGIYLFDWREVAYSAGYWRSPEQIAAITQLHSTIDADFWEHVWLHLSLLHGMVPDQILPASGHAFIGPAWSLSLEWQFYLLAPFLFILATRFFWWFAVVSVALIILKWGLITAGLTFSYGAFLPVKYEFFLLGIALYLYTRGHLAFASVTLVLSLVGLALSDNIQGSVLSFAIWMGFASLSVWPLANSYTSTRWLKSLLTSGPLSYLGKISFSTYLIHIFIVDFVGYQIATVATTEWSKVEVFFAMLLPTFVLTLGASTLLHYLVEAPGMRIGKQMNKAPKLIPSAIYK